MKKHIFLYTGLIIFLSSCSKDDDAGNTDNDTIIGEWILQSTTETDYNSDPDSNNDVCQGKTTTLIFDNQSMINIMDMSATRFTDDPITKVCTAGVGSYSGDAQGEIVLDDQTFPPPKDRFTFVRNGNEIILTDNNGGENGDDPDALKYTFVKVN